MDVPHLRRLRRQAVLSQGQLAQKSGVARGTISKLKTRRRRAYPKAIRSLAASLDVKPQELIGEAHLQEPVDHPAQGKNHSGDRSTKEDGFSRSSRPKWRTEFAREKKLGQDLTARRQPCVGGSENRCM